MMKKIILIALVAVAGISFSGCGGVPSCDGKDTQELLTKILKENLSAKATYKYDAFMTNSTNKEAKKVTCRAQVTIMRGKSKEKEFIEYSAQYTDDGQIFVEIWQ